MIVPPIQPRSLYNQSVVQRAGTTIGKLIPEKLGDFFEMNQGGSIGRIPLVVLSIFFVLGARFVKSRDNHERREVLTRDGLTIGTAMLGVPVLKNLMSKGIEKITKIPMSDKPDKFFHLDDWGIGNVKNWYSKADQMENGALSLAEFIKNRGGDVSKAFAKLDDTAQGYVKTILNGAENTSDNIINGLKTAVTSQDSNIKSAFDNLTTTLSNAENGLCKSAQRWKALPAFAGIALITALLGWGIPAFNIALTRKKLQHKDTPNFNGNVALSQFLEPQISPQQKAVIDSFFAKNQQA